MKHSIKSVLLLSAITLSSQIFAAQRMLVDFGDSGSPTTATGWNNITSGVAGTSIASLKNTQGTLTGIKLSITDGFWQQTPGFANDNGTQSSTLYPASATRDSFFIGLHQGFLDSSAKVQLSNLASGKKYSIKLYASRMTSDTTSDRTTIYTIDGVSKELQVRNNVNTCVEFPNLSASNGVIDISITEKAGAIYGYLGVLDITENALPVANAGSDLTVTLPTSSTTLNGSGTDSDGSISSYAWSQVSGPVTATFSSKTVAKPTVSGLTTAGTYTFRLKVTDNSGASDTDDVIVSVKSTTVTTLSAPKETCHAKGTVSGTNHGFIEYLPEGYAQSGNWPVIIFLHGMGEREGACTLYNSGKHGPIAYERAGHKIAAVVLAPQEFSSGTWDASTIESFRAFAFSGRYKVDPKRFYLTGLSLGGQGVDHYINAYGEKLAAAAPLSTTSHIISSTGASKLVNNHIPCWAAHANQDPTCSVNNTINGFNNINYAIDGHKALTLCSFSGTTATSRTAHYDTVGHKWIYVDGQTPPSNVPKYFVTIYESTSHNIWGRFYNDANMYNWLLKQAKP